MTSQTPTAAGDVRRALPVIGPSLTHGRGPEGEAGTPKLTPAAVGPRCTCVSPHGPRCPYAWPCPVCRARKSRPCRTVLGEPRVRWHAERERRARVVGAPR